MDVEIPSKVARARTASIHRDENQRAEEKATAQCDQQNEKRQDGSSLSTPQSTPKYESEDRLDILQNIYESYEMARLRDLWDSSQPKGLSKQLSPKMKSEEQRSVTDGPSRWSTFKCQNMEIRIFTYK